jgi:transcription elongation factor GreA
MNEARIIELESMVKDAVIVETQKGGTEIGLGSTFTVEFSGKKKTFEVVGSSEADPIAGKISNESPLGQAFIGRAKGDKVEIQVPSGVVTYKIVEIK